MFIIKHLDIQPVDLVGNLNCLNESVRLVGGIAQGVGGNRNPKGLPVRFVVFKSDKIVDQNVESKAPRAEVNKTRPCEARSRRLKCFGKAQGSCDGFPSKIQHEGCSVSNVDKVVGDSHCETCQHIVHSSLNSRSK